MDQGGVGALDRKKVSFEVAEGTVAPPLQLERTHVTRELRSVIWMTIYNNMVTQNAYGRNILREEWIEILANKHVLRDHRMIDEFSSSLDMQTALLKHELTNASYDRFYGLVQWFLREEKIPEDFWAQVELALEHCRSPYRVIDRDTLVPIANDEVRNAIQGGVSDATKHGQPTAANHLKNAVSLLSSGDWADSVRESLHAVEACARLLAPGSNSLGPALAVLSKSGVLHEAMKKGFLALYGYGSDKGGIRHAMLDEGDAEVKEADAVFMVGASASFVSYLLLQSTQATSAIKG